MKESRGNHHVHNWFTDLPRVIILTKKLEGKKTLETGSISSTEPKPKAKAKASKKVTLLFFTTDYNKLVNKYAKKWLFFQRLRANLKLQALPTGIPHSNNISKAQKTKKKKQFNNKIQRRTSKLALLPNSKLKNCSIL